MREKVLIVGIGNPIRQDDGLGPYCEGLINKTLSQEQGKLVDCLAVHQLDVIHCEIFACYPNIIFIDADASDGPEPFVLQEITPEPAPLVFASHIGSIPDLMSLTARLYGVNPRAFLVIVRGTSFEVGEGLSSRAENNGMKAAEFVKGLINEVLPPG